LLEDLEQLRREVRLIEEEAFSEGDYRLALACVRESWRLIELVAKLRGDLDAQSTTNVLQLHLDADTAKKIAETYLSRREGLNADE